VTNKPVELKIKTINKRTTRLPSEVVAVAVLNNQQTMTPGVDWKIHAGSLLVSKRFIKEIRRGQVSLQYHKQATLSSGWLFEVSANATTAAESSETKDHAAE